VSRDEQRIQEKLAIPISLLDGTAAKRPWSNLGDWSETQEYSAACRALACRIGRAAKLGPRDTILEIACGHGASLSVWSEVFGVPVIDAMERQTRALASIEGDRPSALRNLWHADVNSIVAGNQPWPMQHQYDAALIVDAAYHFQALPKFLKEASARLAPGGRLAFTTLILGSQWDRAAGWQKRLVFKLSGAALIPAESLVSEKSLTELFFAAGFEAPVCENLDRDVLEGFARFVARRRRELTFRERGSAGWWKVEATAAACRQLLRTGLLHYVLLKAVKS
jgi:cyclopropane fatty-acyl-phospholipid synthase-like methyltransferase